jgi:HAD superfamily hydrolase (TIGR01549 family)
MICGVILDIDGTLVNSNMAHALAWQQSLQENGFDVPLERIQSLIGMGGDNLLPALVEIEKETEIGKKISERRSHVFKSEHFPTLQAFPQTRELLQRMKQAGLKLVVATSATSEEAEKLLQLAGADGLIDSVTTASDAENSKPDPDVIHAALGKLGCAPDQVIMLGDTPYDIQAAQKAGVRTVAVLSGGWQSQDLTDAIATYSDPADLLARFDESPFVNGSTR